MITQELIQFIKQSISQGKTKEEIRNILLASGEWQESDIDEAFNDFTQADSSFIENKKVKKFALIAAAVSSWWIVLRNPFFLNHFRWSDFKMNGGFMGVELDVFQQLFTSKIAILVFVTSLFLLMIFFFMYKGIFVNFKTNRIVTSIVLIIVLGFVLSAGYIMRMGGPCGWGGCPLFGNSSNSGQLQPGTIPGVVN